MLDRRIMIKRSVCICLWFSAFISVDALYFHLDDGGEKCFIQELANETLLVANYRCSPVNAENEEDKPQESQRGMMVQIKDPHAKIVLSRLYRHNGRFSYKSHEPGVHTICLHTRAEHHSKGKIKIDFDLQVGQHAINRSESIKRKDLTNIEEKYQQLVDKAFEVSKELDYLRYREDMFRRTTEHISHRVLLWMLGETILLIIIGLWQMENLRKFFESKKLV